MEYGLAVNVDYFPQ